MNYYIDFDSTLYNTPRLIERMMETIATKIANEKELNYDEIYSECKSKKMDIYELAKYIANKYGIDANLLIENLNKTILDGKNLVYEDTIPFLQKLKAEGHKLYMLTYCKYSIKFQAIKVAGSGLADFFDGLYITHTPKYELDINYSDGVFIDDNPSDLLGLYSKNPRQVIRIRRDGNKYSLNDIENADIIEYKDFTKLVAETV